MNARIRYWPITVEWRAFPLICNVCVLFLVRRRSKRDREGERAKDNCGPNWAIFDTVERTEIGDVNSGNRSILRIHPSQGMMMGPLIMTVFVILRFAYIDRKSSKRKTKKWPAKGKCSHDYSDIELLPTIDHGSNFKVSCSHPTPCPIRIFIHFKFTLPVSICMYPLLV